MSLWGATVITNLMSAIPWVGQDIVESNNITEPLINLTTMSILPTIGTVSVHALKEKNTSKTDKSKYLSIPYSFLAFLIGLIDGDGYIQVTKTAKGYITIKLVISMHLEDISTLEYIKSVLNLGKISINKDHKSPSCKLIINRTELQEILFPLLLCHNIFFLTETRGAQFDLAMFILKSDKKVYNEIPNKKEIPFLFELPKTPLDYLNLSFFYNWIVGFTMSEGSFFVKRNNDGCFQLKQRLHANLFEAIKLVFNTNRKVSIDKGLYNQFAVSSRKDIQTVINFFSYSGHHPLIGLKNIQYLKWLLYLRNSVRYANLNFPK